MIDTINKYIGYFLVILMTIITLDVLWGVFTRYIMGSQASWSEELARYLLIWIGILGTAFVSGEGGHLSIDLVSDKLTPQKRNRLRKFIALVILLFALAVMVVGGIRLIYITAKLGQTSAALKVPMQYVYGVIPLSGLLIVMHKLRILFGQDPTLSSESK
jgi:TRAP-type C4-dicarboxylate transport system permease small subunit